MDALRRNLNDAAILSDDKRHAELAVPSHDAISGQFDGAMDRLESVSHTSAHFPARQHGAHDPAKKPRWRIGLTYPNPTLPQRELDKENAYDSLTDGQHHD